jgi:D-amino peptidase
MVKVNGIATSEFLLNAYVAGELNVPVILVAGEAQLLNDDVKRHTPWIKTVVLKHSLSRLSARSPSIIRIEKELRETVRKAVAEYRKGNAELLIPKKPVNMQITFLMSHFADVAELLSTAKRTDGLNVEYAAGNMIEAYKTLELLVLAATGMSALLTSLQ